MVHSNFFPISPIVHLLFGPIIFGRTGALIQFAYQVRTLKTVSLFPIVNYSQTYIIIICRFLNLTRDCSAEKKQ